MSVTNERFVFIVEWFDQAADLVRNYQLTFFFQDHSIEMYDIKLKRIFLKRVICEDITQDQLFIGSQILIYSRKIKIIEFGDEFTKNKFLNSKQKTFAWIKPQAYNTIGLVIKSLEENNFLITKLKMVQLQQNQAQKLFYHMREQNNFNTLIQESISDLSVGLELIANESINRLSQIVGQESAIYASPSSQQAQRDSDYFFGQQLQSARQANNCTCCVIKPHAIKDRNAGAIIQHILDEGFEISGMEMFTLDKPCAEEFLEIYKNLIPEYPQMVTQLTLGSCIAMEIRQENPVNSFRQICGPYDPDIAKTIRKETIRSKYGSSIDQNAVHCTDLECDGQLECDYFFNVLSGFN